MIASSLSSRPERGNSITNGNRLHRASLEIASVSLATKVGLEGKRRVSMSRDSVDMDRRKADDKSSSNDELSLGKLPDQSEILKASSVMKLCQEEWQPRCIYLTGKLDLLDKLRTQTLISDKIHCDLMPAGAILIAVPDSEDVSDRIPLVRPHSISCSSKPK